MQELLEQARDCRFCEKHLPIGARPIVKASEKSKIILISQAPGRIVHETGVPFNDQSGKKLREWLGVNSESFYETSNFAILPMGYCYPGKAKSGDAPPRKECAPLWHKAFLEKMQKAELVILIGAYAASYYITEKKNLTEKVRNFEDYLPQYWCLPHPSPINRFWRQKNPWFEKEIVPQLQDRIQQILKK